MARTTRKHMSKQEKADWDELYEYVRTEVWDMTRINLFRQKWY